MNGMTNNTARDRVGQQLSEAATHAQQVADQRGASSAHFVPMVASRAADLVSGSPGSDRVLVLRDCHQSGWHVVRVIGDLDIATAPILRGHLAALLSCGHQRLILDLASLDFIDSTGLGTLVGGLKRARARGGQLALAGTTGRTKKILRVTGLDKIFANYATAAEAIVANCQNS